MISKPSSAAGGAQGGREAAGSPTREAEAPPDPVVPPLLGFWTPHERVLLYPDGDAGELITKQEMAAECDINNILAQFSRTGIIDHVNRSAAQWLDLPSDLDFQSSLEVVRSGEEAFATLPSKVREAYGNDPYRFLAALADPAERDRLVEFGIFKSPVVDPSPPGGVAGVATPPTGVAAPSGGGT